MDIRTVLARSENARVEVGRDGVLHVHAGPMTLHVDRAFAEELTTTLARAMVHLAKTRPKKATAVLELVRSPEAAE